MHSKLDVKYYIHRNKIYKATWSFIRSFICIILLFYWIRFNFSHGDHVAHGACLDRLQEAVAKRPGSNVAVMLGMD